MCEKQLHPSTCYRKHEETPFYTASSDIYYFNDNRQVLK